MGGVSAAVSKTAAAPIERVKLLIQNQDEMMYVFSNPGARRGGGEEEVRRSQNFFCEGNVS